MKRPRSPKFPAVPLQKALKFAKTLHQKFGEETFTPPQAAEALEFSSLHGRAVKVVAALRAYGFIEKTETDSPREMNLSEIALNLSNPNFSGTDAGKEALKIAALSPMLFRKLFQRARNASEEELAERLVSRGFTEGGAARAAKVFRMNFAFADLDTLSEIPDGLPDRGPRKNVGPSRKVAARKHAANTEPPCRKGLTLPLSSGSAFVPSGMTEEEHTLLMQTLRLWKDRLVKPAC